MKVYRISKAAFWGISALILTLPLSREWKLITRGEKISIQVGVFEPYLDKERFGDPLLVEANRIEFVAGNTNMLIRGPNDYDLGEGKELVLWYDPNDPSDYCLLNFMSLYNSGSGVLTFMLILFWSAFYLSFGYYVKHRRGPAKKPKPRDPNAPGHRFITGGGRPRPRK